jgi:signal transduction histidine kinase
VPVSAGDQSLQLFFRSNERWILAAMLCLLHAATWWDFGQPLSRSLMLAHLGLFLIWQPLWSHAQRLSWRTGVVFALLGAGFIHWLNWWLLFSWLILLVGLVGGLPAFEARDRLAHMLAMLFLVSDLLIACVVHLFPMQPLPSGVEALFKYGLFIVPPALGLIDSGKRPEGRLLQVDLFRGLTVALLTAMLAAGALLTMYRSGGTYTEALMLSLITLAGFLLLLSWLFSPRVGFRELNQLWERSLLNIGTPFEQWLTELARLAQQIDDPPDFLQASMQKLVNLPWLNGVTWSTSEASGACGIQTLYRVELTVADLDVSLYSSRPLGPSLFLHFNLLVTLLAHFYTAKLRERELAQRAHLQAIYETGARVTHDIKNLLQSLYTMTMALSGAEESGGTFAPERMQRAQGLLKRQLPYVIQRLKLALDKLQAPQLSEGGVIDVRTWWNSVTARYAAPHISFEASLLETACTVPAELVDSILDNLLENANDKRKLEPGLRIRVLLSVTSERLSLTVCDDGSPILTERAKSLFTQPVKSTTGLGIGLYQASKQVEMMGYSLSLSSNVAGHVCFELLGRPYWERRGEASVSSD